MVIVALDVGQARIGVAVSDETEFIATPLTVIHRRSNAQAIDAIARIVRDEAASLVIVGLPVSFDGKLHAQADSVQSFAEKLRRAVGVPLDYADETLSTVRAEELLRASGMRADRIRARIDAAAAAVILQEFLDQRARRSTQPAGPAYRHDTLPGGNGRSGNGAEETGG